MECVSVRVRVRVRVYAYVCMCVWSRSEKCAGLMQLMSSLDPGSSALVSADYMAAIGEELATTGQLPVFADCVCRFLLTKVRWPFACGVVWCGVHVLQLPCVCSSSSGGQRHDLKRVREHHARGTPYILRPAPFDRCAYACLCVRASLPNPPSCSQWT